MNRQMGEMESLSLKEAENLTQRRRKEATGGHAAGVSVKTEQNAT